MTAISFFLFGTYCFLWLKQPEYEWIPPVCLVCIIYFSCMGLVSIPYILTIEIFPKEVCMKWFWISYIIPFYVYSIVRHNFQIREISLAMMVSFIWVIMFVTGTIFPFVMDAAGLTNCMILLGVMCILNAIFGLFFIPETRGKSYDEIVDLLVKWNGQIWVRKYQNVLICEQLFKKKKLLFSSWHFHLRFPLWNIYDIVSVIFIHNLNVITVPR